jgi:hypothetical protein
MLRPWPGGRLHLVSAPVHHRCLGPRAAVPEKSGALVLRVKRSFVRLTLPSLCA